MAIYICIGIAGFIVGLVASLLICKGRKYDGAFRVNLSDPMKDVFTMEWWRDLEGVQDLKVLRFKVIVEDDSREKQGL